MYERMLDKHIIPTVSEMTEYCGKNAGLFNLLNEWLSETYGTVQKVVFPYGNNYGWGISHKKKEKLVCNIFAENNSFTVMMRLSDKQFDSIYDRSKNILRNISITNIRAGTAVGYTTALLKKVVLTIYRNCWILNVHK